MAILDNPNRADRVGYLKGSCVRYFEEHQKSAARANQASTKLFAAVNELCKKKGTTIADILPKLPYEHMVFAGGSHINPKADKLIEQIVLGTYVAIAGSVITEMVNREALREMAIASLMRQAPGVRNFSQALIQQEIGWINRRWYGNIRSLKIRGIGMGVTLLLTVGIEALFYNLEKQDLTSAINDLAWLRLRGYYQSNLMSGIATHLEAKCMFAEMLLKNQQKPVEIEEIKKLFFTEVIQEINQIETDTRAKAIDDLKESDKKTNQYIADDPILDLKFLAEREKDLKKMIVKSGSVVDSIESEMRDGTVLPKMGGEGGMPTPVELEAEETIAKVLWKTGQYGGKKVIYDLTIITNKGKKYGPYGNGTEVNKSNSVSNEFNTPERYVVEQLVDLAATMKYQDTEVILESPTYIEDLKMVVRVK